MTAATTAPFTRVGLQIPNFTYPGVANEDLFETVASSAVAAEEAGFDTVFVMDHFFQLPMLGPPEHEMFECYTLLSALAARTSTVRLGALVTGVTYRNPAVLAKEVTALDVISRGRAILGIGAAWFEMEHAALDVRFPPLKERYEHLTDALHICKAMFTQRQSSYSGVHHSITDAWNVPPPVQEGGPTILIGGQGETKTFRLAAEHADELNTTAAFAELPRKLAALHGHLDDIGRARDAVHTSVLGSLFIAPTQAEAEAEVSASLRAAGVEDPAAALEDERLAQALLGRVLWGDPDHVAAAAKEVMATGIDGIVVNMPSAGHDPARIRLAAEALTSVLR
jgi:F420-dependent oxidoreductase-like protein